MLAGRPKSVVYPRCPVPMEGRLAIVTNAGRDAVDAAARETNAVCLRTAKSCGSDAPIVGVKSAIRSAGDGVKKRGHRGEREVSRKTIARGMPGRSGVTVVTMLVCFFHCMRGRGRIARPAFPAPSDFLGRTSCKNSGKSRRGIAELCFNLQRHCEERSDEAIHSYFAATWIASRSLSSGGALRRPVCHALTVLS